ncbi:MAG: hypothetical protein CSA72_12460 [Rhodobacterales bacterium]|nr:MAG: hypothetical protein CSA72_12460 [Rhodobacterales bacterium]
MNYVWTNTESLLIHFISGLLDIDNDKAVVIFLTVSTFRARIDLVERLVKLPGTPTKLQSDVLELTSSFKQLSATRNKYNHCIYAFDPDGGNPRTILMRISDRKTGIKFGAESAINQETVEAVQSSINQISALNTRIWAQLISSGFVRADER